jgi:NTP pyrophosphatase (non-canonical NTP hydrolase)
MELADTAIRLFDLAGSLNIDLEKEISKKMKVNEGRPIKHGKNC